MNKYFFIGIAGSGMSAIAQYLANIGNIVEGSDRLFINHPKHKIRQQLESSNIKTYEQGKSTIATNTDYVIVSTAIETTVPEYKQATLLKIPIIHRSEMLTKITADKRTIAIAGTSGKSTTTAMLYTILSQNDYSPSMLNGSGLVCLQKTGKIGNATVGKSNILIIEADESDGTLVNYTPEIGIILNIDRDHLEFEELEQIFGKFANQTTKQLIVNLSNDRAKKFSKKSNFDFGTQYTNFFPINIKQNTNGLSFKIQNTNFFIPAIGVHNAENATAAIATANYLGINIKQAAEALKKYQGIERRMKILGNINETIFIDDYAHNPAKIQSAIKSAQALGQKVVAFFQPHGYKPLDFMKNELIEMLKKTLRKQDEFFLAKVFYAGGTVKKTISSEKVVELMKKQNINAFLANPRTEFKNQIATEPQNVVLIMGARDPSLKNFAEETFKSLTNINR